MSRWQGRHGQRGIVKDIKIKVIIQICLLFSFFQHFGFIFWAIISINAPICLDARVLGRRALSPSPAQKTIGHESWGEGRGGGGKSEESDRKEIDEEEMGWREGKGKETKRPTKAGVPGQ